MSITEERKQKVDFTNKYYNTPPAIAVAKDLTIADVSPAALAGKTIGAQGSTIHQNYAEATYKDLTVKSYPTAEEYKLDLANGRIDAVNDDVMVLKGWLAYAGRRLLQDRSAPSRRIRRSMAKAQALPCARAKPNCATS